MKFRKTKIWSTVLMLVLLTGILAVPARADAPVITQDIPGSQVVLAGQPIQLMCSAEGENLTYQWYNANGVLAGQTSNVLNITATAEYDDHHFYCHITGDNGAVDTSHCKITVISPPGISSDIPSALTVTEGESFQLSCAINGRELSYQWYTTVSVLDGQTGPTLSLTAVSEYNGLGFYCQAINPAGTVSTQVCTVTVTPAATPAPEVRVTKDPTGETIQEGGNAIFIAKAENATGYAWKFISSDGSRSYDYTKAQQNFPGLRVSGGNTNTLTVSNVPSSLNGWTVACVFKGGAEDVQSASAIITVTQAQAKAPSISRQPVGAEITIGDDTGFTVSVVANAPDGGVLTYQWYSSESGNLNDITPITSNGKSATYRPVQTSGTKYYCVAVTNNMNGKLSEPVFSNMVKVIFHSAEENGADATAKPGTHVHSFSKEWKGNDLSHWHECSCGAHQDEAFHSFEWEIIKEPTKKEDGKQVGTCTVCGYQTTESIPAGMDMDGDKDGGGISGWLIAVFVILAVIILAGGGVVIYMILKKKPDPSEDDDDPYEQ